jgi:hypothetical protein
VCPYRRWMSLEDVMLLYCARVVGVGDVVLQRCPRTCKLFGWYIEDCVRASMLGVEGRTVRFLEL